MTRNVVRLLLACAVCVGSNASARDAEGRLANIKLPHEGRPAVVAPGESFEVTLGSPAGLHLIGETGPIELTQETITSADGIVLRVTVPAGTRPGAYDLEASTEDARDRTSKAVWVIDADLATYTVALLADPHINSENIGAFRARIDEINESAPALVLILGDLTASGTADDFQEMIRLLAQLHMPAYVCPGPADRQQGLYDAYFGPMPYAFRFGPDGYLAIDTSQPTLGIARESGDLYRLRRSIRGARWSAGFTHRYTPAMALRDQVTLFVDDPLDALVFTQESLLHRRMPALGSVPFLEVSRFQTVQVTPTSAQATEPQPPEPDPFAPRVIRFQVDMPIENPERD